MKTLFFAAVVCGMVSSPVLAEGEVPAAGSSKGSIAIWQTLPIGTQVMYGGTLFVVVAGGLALADDDDGKIVISPTPNPPPATTTTTTTS